MLRLLCGCLLLAGCANAGDLGRLRAPFELGLDRDSVHAAAQSRCASIATQVYTAAQAAPYSSQEQIDCLGYEVFGKDRKLELLVNEGRLGFYWILADKAELGALRRQLEADIGYPVCETPEYAIFEGGRVALRFEPAEVLVGLPEDVKAITGGCP